MAIIEQWGVPLAVAGMLLATLLMSALVKRYQEHQVLVRARLQRLGHSVHALEQALDVLRTVPLSREMRVLLRGELLARLQRMARLSRRYPGIRQRIGEAETALNAEGAPNAAGVGPIDDEPMFRRIVHAIDELTEVFAFGDTLQRVPPDVREIFRRELGGRRAEVHARFHLVQSVKRRKTGDTSRARAHLTTLLHVLRRRGPSTDFVRELYAEAEAALTSLSQSEMPVA